MSFYYLQKLKGDTAPFIIDTTVGCILQRQKGFQANSLYM